MTDTDRMRRLIRELLTRYPAKLQPQIKADFERLVGEVAQAMARRTAGGRNGLLGGRIFRLFVDEKRGLLVVARTERVTGVSIVVTRTPVVEGVSRFAAVVAAVLYHLHKPDFLVVRDVALACEPLSKILCCDLSCEWAVVVAIPSATTVRALDAVGYRIFIRHRFLLGPCGAGLVFVKKSRANRLAASTNWSAWLAGLARGSAG